MGALVIGNDTEGVVKGLWPTWHDIPTTPVWQKHISSHHYYIVLTTYRDIKHTRTTTKVDLVS